MSRPEVLFPLFSDLTVLDGIGPKMAQNLAPINLGHEHIQDDQFRWS